MHFELCKCEEQMDQISKAKDETVKALMMDYGSLIGETAATNVCTYVMLCEDKLYHAMSCHGM